jgi:acyl-CoA synthetase (AMP-forming)/AMP-acid ligase II
MASGASLIDRLREISRRFPERVALVQHDTSISYAALWHRIAALAGLLRREGLQRGDRACVLLDSSIDYVVACYAAMAAGAVVVPLNTAARARDLLAWMSHAGAGWLLTRAAQPQLATLGTDSGVNRVMLIEQVADEPDAPADAAFLALPQSAPACILYTSGTTGDPKGVLLSHGNLSANAAAIVEYLELTERDSIVCVLPFHYSYGSSVLHTHLFVGATLIIEPNLVYPHRVMQTLQRSGATGFAGVPSTYSLLLKRVSFAEFDLSSLRYVTQAGGAMSPSVTSRLREALPGVQLFIMYGQTEATARITFLPPRDIVEKPASVGLPVRGTRIQIRTESGELCRSGEVGDVWIEGPGVMMGYWRDEAATAAVLRSGWLNTRDTGYLDGEGYLYLQGRRSDIIKVGAHRVNPQDVEAVVAELPEVAEVAAVGVDDELLGQAIKVCVVSASGCQVDPQKVKAHCLAGLASYKVPKLVEVVASLPKTTSGKIRRHEL